MKAILLSLITITIFSGGIFGVYSRFMADPFVANKRFAIVQKEVIPPTQFVDRSRKTALGMDQKLTYPPKYKLLCLGEIDRKHYHVLVTERYYDSVPRNAIVTREEIDRFQHFETSEALFEYLATIEIAPVPLEENESFIDKALDLLNNILSKT